jgi:hypothetical protein
MQRIAASVDGTTGRLKLHLSKRYKHNLRGAKFSLPKPGSVRYQCCLIYDIHDICVLELECSLFFVFLHILLYYIFIITLGQSLSGRFVVAGRSIDDGGLESKSQGQGGNPIQSACPIDLWKRCGVQCGMPCGSRHVE